jgi:probable HAF family extracellular repeat protein
MQPLPSLPGMAYASGWSLNNRNQVVGISGNGPGDARPVFWEAGRVTALELFTGDNQGLAYAINERGQIVGMSMRIEGAIVGQARPMFWNKREAGALPIGQYLGGHCTDINEKGLIIGAVHTALPADFFFQALPALWENGNLRVLGTLGGQFGSAWDVNAKGQIVGSSQSADGAIRGTLWEDGKPTDQGGRGGTFTALWAINNKGQMVGESTDADGVDHAILIDDGKVIDLNDRIPAGSGWELLFATGINERGQIAGTGFLNGQVRGFLLTPTK